MDYEKRCKELVEAIKQLQEANPSDEGVQNWANDVLYGTKETDDVRIRKALVEHFSSYYSGSAISDDVVVEEALTWLEKQGEKSAEWHSEDEQNLNACLSYIPDEFLRRWLKDAIYVKYNKSADKVEPKFHEGDWIIYRDEGCTEILRIIGVTGTHYLCNDISDDYCRNLSINFIDNHNYHLWTIRDVKDGDVLAWDNSKCIVIFKNIYDKESFNSYGCVGHCTGTFEAGLSYHDIEGVHPATKEQRDLLFSKMKEVGYEWNAEKKMLKNIEKQQVDDFDAELNALLKKYEHLPKEELAEPLEFYLEAVRGNKPKTALEAIKEEKVDNANKIVKQPKWTKKDDNLVKDFKKAMEEQQ